LDYWIDGASKYASKGHEKSYGVLGERARKIFIKN
jgi:hypothetical protein